MPPSWPRWTNREPARADCNHLIGLSIFIPQKPAASEGFFWLAAGFRGLPAIQSTNRTLPEMIDLRFATESDLPALMALVNRAFTVENFFKYNERLDPVQTHEYFESGRFLVSEQEGRIAGCIYVEVKGERGYFGLLAVDPARQKTGLGARLVAAAEEYARELGALHMDMTIVNLREELPAYYEKLGYVPCGTEEIPPAMIGRVKQECHFIRYSKPLGKARG